LEDIIDNPETGLKKQIADTELALLQNTEAQTEETKTRTEENVAYQKDIKNLVEAESILKKAIKVLSKYYDSMEEQVKEGVGGAFMQTAQKEDPDAPDTWGKYEGQSKVGASEDTGVIAQLEFILAETVKEENAAHKEEEDAQAEYEDSMIAAKKLEANQEKSIAKLKETLAEKIEELALKNKELKELEATKKTTEDYLLKIKPGCDFIDANFKLRNTNRATEKGALENAIKLIKGTPVYKTYVAESKVEGFGDCAELCEIKSGREVIESKSADCQACLADVTVPAYCAGHPGTPGCPSGRL
jgi:hypothetical protein